MARPSQYFVGQLMQRLVHTCRLACPQDRAADGDGRRTGEGELPAPGADLDPAAGASEPAGVAVLAARDPAAPAQWSLLVEARLESAQAGLAFRGAALKPLELPYALADAAQAPDAP